MSMVFRLSTNSTEYVINATIRLFKTTVSLCLLRMLVFTVYPAYSSPFFVVYICMGFLSVSGHVT